MKKEFTLTKISGTGKQYIRVVEAQWLHGFKASEKVGMIEIEPGDEAANNAKLEALKAGKIQVQFGNQNRNTGFYETTLAFVGAPVAAETLETTA